MDPDRQYRGQPLANVFSEYIDFFCQLQAVHVGGNRPGYPLAEPCHMCPAIALINVVCVTAGVFLVIVVTPLKRSAD